MQTSLNLNFNWCKGCWAVYWQKWDVETCQIKSTAFKTWCFSHKCWDQLAVCRLDFAPLYSVWHLMKRGMGILLLCLAECQGGNSELADVLGWGPVLHRRMQLHEEPFWPLRRPCCVVATDWIKFQKCLKEMPSPSPTPIFRRISLSPWSVPIPCENTHEQSKNSLKWLVCSLCKWRPKPLTKTKHYSSL